MPVRDEAPGTWEGVAVQPYLPRRSSTPGVHPWLIDFETKTIRGEACFRAALTLRERGYRPDVIVAHPGWGESLFLKEVWPEAKLGIYCEFFYRHEGADTGFDPALTPLRDDDPCRMRMKNLNNRLHFEVADAGLSPTRWQASGFPEPFRSRISVIHDGIDTAAVTPDPAARLSLMASDGSRLTLTREDEVITFANRNLEPYRGYHVFMRALPALLRQRPRARVVIVGGEGVSYGARAPEGTWKEHFIREVRPAISDNDWARVHFLPPLPHPHFVRLLQVSTVHVYLTYPFVLGWSFLEAMSAGCALVASATAPVQEVIEDGTTGLLVDFFDGEELVAQVDELLSSAALRATLGTAARQYAAAHFDLRGRCLPRQVAWVEGVAAH